MAMDENMFYEDLRGHKQNRKINKSITNIEDFVDSIGGYPWLFMAANPHLSAREIWRYLSHIKGGPNERSLSWIKKRRKMFRPPDYVYKTREDRDGRAEEATALMADNPELSIRDLVVLLAKHRIIRSREWVRTHRCDSY
jgi:hypothetical protein